MLRRVCLAAIPAAFATICGCVTVTNQDPTPAELNTIAEIRQAYETKNRLQHEGRELREIGDDLDAITSRISEHSIAMGSGSIGTVVKSLIQRTSELRKSAQDILDRGPQYIAKIDSFAGSLNSAPAVFAKAADLFKSYQKEETFPDLAEEYRQVATLFANLATRTQGSSLAVQNSYDRERLLATLQYIRHQERFLGRLEAALYAQDFAISEIESLARDIDAHAKKFEELRVQIRDLNAAFRNVEAVAATQQPSHEPRPGDVPSQTHEPPKVDDNPPAEKPAVAPVSYVPPRATTWRGREVTDASPTGADSLSPAYGGAVAQGKCDPNSETTFTVSQGIPPASAHGSLPTYQQMENEPLIPPELEEIGLRATAAARGISGVNR